MDIERLLRTALSDQAAEVKASPELWEQVRTKMLVKQRAGGATGSRLPVARLLHRLPRWQAVSAAAFGAILLMGSLVMALSPAAKAWVGDQLVEIISWKVVRTNNGYQLVRAPVEDVQKEGGVIFQNVQPPRAGDAPATIEEGGVPAGGGRPSFVQFRNGQRMKDVTLEEARAMVDFPVRVPVYLPAGYQGPDIAAINEPGKGSVTLTYHLAPSDSAGRDLLELTFMKGIQLTPAGDAIREVEVRGRKGYWAEFPVASIPSGPDAGHTLSRVEGRTSGPSLAAVAVGGPNDKPTVNAGHILSWEEDGIVVQMNSSAGLSLEEMLKIAASLK